MQIHKKDVIQLLEEIALYLEIKGENPFRINAYRRAAMGLERDERSLSEIERFTDLRGIGEGTNAVIMEFIETGSSTVLEELKVSVPEGLIDLLSLPGLGGKRIATLYKKLGITDMASLQQACEKGAVEKIPGFGKKSTDNLLQAIKKHQQRPDRLPLANVLPIAEEIENELKNIEDIVKFSRAGSLRRVKETIKDLDFVIATEDQEAVRKQLLKLPHVAEVISEGHHKVSLTFHIDHKINVDFRLVPLQSFATTLHHFTGSKDHNITMRQLAKARGEKISEYGVEEVKTGKIHTFKTEEDFFHHFSLHYIPPEARENNGEEVLFKENYPIIKKEDIRGDLHLHTAWSDGAQSIEEMILAAIKRGYEYIAITDHSKYLQVANGLTAERLQRQMEEIYFLREKYPQIHIFTGIEMDILPTGELDFPPEILKKVDFVIASIHSGFQQSTDEIMHRLEKALANPFVNMIAHPTGRLIGRREGYAIDLEVFLKRAKETNTIIEINAHPNRLDLPAQWVHQAEKIGAKLAINTDAHSEKMYDYMPYGVSVAKKGLLRKERVVNTWPLNELKRFLNNVKGVNNR